MAEISTVKYKLPDNHGLPAAVLNDPRLMPRTDGNPSLTDVQFNALEQGSARGVSTLVVAPTSTGKTLIGFWVMAAALKRGDRAVYLVTHRALANQKLAEIKSLFLESYLFGMRNSIVLATGDDVLDGDDAPPVNPLGAAILVATYEKYMALLSAGGLPSDMSQVVVVCDEIQLISDETRGQCAEILLTVLKRAHCRQIVGLSAVIDKKDAHHLADWLKVVLIYSTTREKTLTYECRTPLKTYRAVTGQEDVETLPPTTRDTLSIIDELRKDKKRLPIIVFCMTKPQTYDLAASYYQRVAPTAGPLKKAIGWLFGSPPESAAETLLSRYFPLRFAVHNADLLDEERRRVEDGLASGELDVVFATSTLAAGVNFPLATAVFHSWTRWNAPTKTWKPIDASEFHNMAGRAGRMGLTEDNGVVIFVAETATDIGAATNYLKFDQLTTIEPRIRPDQFETIALQLISSGFCNTPNELFEVLSSTLSGVVEASRNTAGLAAWRDAMTATIADLRKGGFIVSR